MELLAFLKNISERHELWGYDEEIIGSVIWLPNGIELKERFCGLCKHVFNKKGYKQVELPFFIPLKQYKLQKQHYNGLMPYTIKISHPRIDKYGIRVLRTTSEIPFTYLFKNLSKIKNLPFKYFQIVSVFRVEKDFLPPIRALEINPFIESYTAFLFEQEAENQIKIEVVLYKEILDKLGIVYVISRRPKYDTFPEASYTIAFDAILPTRNVTQVATVHHLGISFAKAFQWKVKNRYPIQTSTGISARVLAVMLITYYDEKEGRLFFTLKNQNNILENEKTLKVKQKLYSFIKEFSSLNEIKKEHGWIVAKLPIIDNENIILKLKERLPQEFKILGIDISQKNRNKKRKCVISNKITSDLVNIAREVI